MTETSVEVLNRYVQDAIAAEKTFETQLHAFAGQASDPSVKQLFDLHARETRTQYERLSARLGSQGESPSGVRSLLAHILGWSTRPSHAGLDEQERTAQNLITAFAVENSELAMYEALANMAEAAGDNDMASLARSIQTEEKAAAEKIWRLLPTAALGEQARGTSELGR